MSISPPSDLVLDVLRASEPQHRQAAAQRLIRAGGARSASEPSPVITATAAKPARTTFNTDEAMIARRNQALLSGARQPARVVNANSPQRQFETMVLQDFVHKMLPSKTDATFGRGTAGSIWKSWMAEAVAKEIADAGGVGISDMVQPAAAVPRTNYNLQPAAINSVPSFTSPYNAHDENMSSRQHPLSALGEFFAKLQEVFLDILGGGESVHTDRKERIGSRPEFDV